ncbi:hypothetical protein NWO28_11400 [Enterococcus faecalis]|nr:hypothetical protein [Enterococcus faecalis]
MRYCQFEGCSNTTEKGAYCSEHARKSRKRKSQSMFIIMITNHFIEQKNGKMSLTLSMKEKVVAVKDVAVLYLEGKRIGIM